MKTGILQMDIRLGEPEKNFVQARKMVLEAARRGAEVTLLPELWTTGYALAELPSLLDGKAGQAFAFLEEVAREAGIWVIGGSVAERDGTSGHIFNTCAVYDPRGKLRAKYRKIHLFGMMDEDRHLSAGELPVRFDCGSWRSGLMICYDLRFPELSRLLAVQGAQILFVPAEWPAARLAHWRLLLQARAVENQCYVAAANTVGRKGKETFPGHSMVVDPWGRILYEAGSEEEIGLVEVDRDEVAAVRTAMSVLTDRKPECYS